MENHIKVKHIVEENNLDMLILPETTLFEMDFGKNLTLQVIAEKKVNFNQFLPKEETKYGIFAYEYFYKQFEKNPELEQAFRKLFRQLALYICKTGFWDAYVDNIPLNMEQQKVVLVDINDLFNYHNIANYDIKTKTMVGIIDLINVADERFIKDILEVAKQEQINLDYQTLFDVLEKEYHYIEPFISQKLEKLKLYCQNNCN